MSIPPENTNPIELCIYDLLENCTVSDCRLVHLDNVTHKKFCQKQTDDCLELEEYHFTIDDETYSCCYAKHYEEEVNTGILTNLYMLTLFTYLIEKNYKKFVEYCSIGINNNDAQFVNFLGNFYFEIEQNYEKAAEHYIASVKLNYKISIVNLGHNYYYEKNYEKAIEHYSIAISLLKDVSAMSAMGDCYYFALKDYKKAAEYYLMAIDRGSNFAMFRLAQYYFNIEKDNDAGIKYCNMAIKNEFSEDCCRFENYYTNITHGSTVAARRLGDHYYSLQKYKKAITFYLIAVENFDYVSMERLADYYKNIEKKQETAIEYYTKAVKNGSTVAISPLVAYYESTQNSEKMLEYLHIGLKNKDPLSMANLGYYYDKVTIDIEKSIFYSKMAIEHGYYQCAYRLGNHYCFNGDYGNAVTYYKVGVNGGCPYAMNAMGFYYYNILSDHKGATKYAYMAIKKGCYEDLDSFVVFALKSYELDKFVNACLLAKEEEPLIKKLTEDLNPTLKEKTIMRLLEYFAHSTNNKILSSVLVSTCVSKRTQIFVEHFKYHPDSLTIVRLKEHFENTSKHGFVEGAAIKEAETKVVEIGDPDPALIKINDDKIDFLINTRDPQEILDFLNDYPNGDLLGLQHVSQKCFNNLVKHFGQICSISILTKIIYYVENEEIDLNEINNKYSLSTPNVCNIAINDFYLSVSKKIMESVAKD